MISRSPAFPFLSLLVSGGHTTLYMARGVGEYTALGETVDDAVGEAFDKVARMLGLGYPGGPAVEALAANGNAATVTLPRPMPGSRDMSFAGLKTAVRHHLDRHPMALAADVAAAFQAAAVDVLIDRVERAVAETGVRRVALGGGVAANGALRERLKSTGLDVYLPPKSRCTDNAAMIAHAGRLRFLVFGPGGLDVSARPRWSIAG